jgi:hypothetical protein
MGVGDLEIDRITETISRRWTLPTVFVRQDESVGYCNRSDK